MQFLKAVFEFTEHPATAFALVALVFYLALVIGAIVYWRAKGDESEVQPLVDSMSDGAKLMAGIGYVFAIAAVFWGVLNIGILRTAGAMLLSSVIVIGYPGRKPVGHWWRAVPFLSFTIYFIVGVALDWTELLFR